MKLKYEKTCRCGAVCKVGTEVRMDLLPDEHGMPRWEVTHCPSCNDTLSGGVADTGVGMKQPGSNLQVRIEKRRAKLKRIEALYRNHRP